MRAKEPSTLHIRAETKGVVPYVGTAGTLYARSQCPTHQLKSTMVAVTGASSGRGGCRRARTAAPHTPCAISSEGLVMMNAGALRRREGSPCRPRRVHMAYFFLLSPPL